MKKNYQKPATQIVKIQAVSMLAGSVNSVRGNAELNYGGGSDGTEGGAARVKGSGNHDVWSDDWSN